MYGRYIKRLMDIAGAGCALILLTPVLAAIALLVRAKMGSPVLFKQTRPRLHERPFTIYKYRTMTDERDACGELLPNAQRLGRMGMFLRRSSSRCS